MNDELQEFARKSLRDGLNKLPDTWNKKFKLMYGRDGGKRSVEEAKLIPIDQIVDEMPSDKLDWAMKQVNASIEKLSEIKTRSIDIPILRDEDGSVVCENGDETCWLGWIDDYDCSLFCHALERRINDGRNYTKTPKDCPLWGDDAS